MNARIRARNYMVHHLPVGNYYPDLTGEYGGWEHEPWMETAFGIPGRPTELLRIGASCNLADSRAENVVWVA